MNARPLAVLLDGGPDDATLVRSARDYADRAECSVLLVRVMPLVTRAGRRRSGQLILPWERMQALEANARYELDKLRQRYLRGGAVTSSLCVRFGEVVDEVAAVVEAEQAHALLAHSRPRRILGWLSRDLLLQRRVGASLMLMTARGDLHQQRAAGLFRAPAQVVTAPPVDKVRLLSRLPAFASISSRQLARAARSLDEVSLDPDTILIREGQPNQAFWITAEGDLEVSVGDRMVRQISPPAMVGLPSMLDSKPAWATVRTTTRVTALVAGVQQFSALCADDRITLRLWAETGARLRQHMLASRS